MSLRLNKYLKDLRREAHRFECTWGRNQRRFICFIPSLILVWLLDKGFTSDFVAYASSALSILIGLFTTSIIFILDKYQSIDLEQANSREKLWDTQAYNYTKQFAYITGYSIVLCLFTLVFLSFSALFEDFFSIDISLYYLDLKKLDIISLSNFLCIIVVIFQRLMIFYWLASIVYNTLYVISSMVKYMIVKIERKW